MVFFRKILEWIKENSQKIIIFSALLILLLISLYFFSLIDNNIGDFIHSLAFFVGSVGMFGQGLKAIKFFEKNIIKYFFIILNFIVILVMTNFFIKTFNNLIKILF